MRHYAVKSAEQLETIACRVVLCSTMKALLLLLLVSVPLTSCWAAPRRSPYSPGGRAITPMERHDRSVLSPGGRAITPREPYHRHH
jgi:hypothetical protein